MNEIEQLQAKVEELQNELKQKDEQIEVLTAEKADYTKQIEDYETKVNELEETNNLKSRKISDLLLNSASVIDKNKGSNDEKSDDNSDDEVCDLDDLIGGL